MSDVTALESARRALGLPLLSLWLAYFALGGTKSADELGAYLREAPGAAASDADHDAVVHALNEACLDAGREPALPYRTG